VTWFKVDDNLAFHRKVIVAGNAAMGLWVRAGSWSAQQLTDGFVPDEMIALIGTPAQRAKLIKARLWIEVEGGCQFHEWSENGRQPTSESVRKDRAAAAKRQAEWRARRSATSQVNGSRNGVTNTSVTEEVTPEVTPTPTRPDPTRTSNEVRTNTRAQREPRAPRADRPPDGFADFWDAYPRKVAKRAAAKAYAAALDRGAEPAELLTAVRRYAALAASSDPKFVAHPTTWLNQGRYDDEIPVAPAGLAVGHHPATPMQGTSSQRVNAILALRRGDNR
jgi:hypothetical protein